MGGKGGHCGLNSLKAEHSVFLHVQDKSGGPIILLCLRDTIGKIMDKTQNL